MRIHRYIVWGACMVPFGCLCIFYGGLCLDFPYGDEWEFATLLQRYYMGSLDFSDFWVQHQHHRMVIPRFIMLILVLVSRWDVRWELATNLTLGVGIFIYYASRLHAIARNNGLYPRWSIPLISLLAFSLSQWENWFSGWQLAVFIQMIAVLFTVEHLSNIPIRKIAFPIALLSALVASFSYANGLLVWPLGLLFLFYLPLEQKVFRVWLRLIWGGVGSFVFIVYFYGYQNPNPEIPLFHGFGYPLATLYYALIYLGQPVAGYNCIAASIAGGIAVYLWGHGLWKLHCNMGQRNPWWGGGVMLGLYSIISALLTSYLHPLQGMDLAAASRHATLANPLWFAVCAFYMWTWATRPPSNTGANSIRIVSVLLGLSILLSSMYGAQRWLERYNELSGMRDDLVSKKTVNDIHLVYPQELAPDKPTFLETREFMREHQLGIFSKSPKLIEDLK